MFQLLNLTILIASIGSGMGAQLGAARLLYGMGRSNALPQGFFAVVDAKRHIPRNNVILTGPIALAGALILNYERGAELLNFGAFVAFMGVNAAAFARFYLRHEERCLTNFVPAALGICICAFTCWNLSWHAKLGGSIWPLVGFIYCIWRTRAFTEKMMSFEMVEDSG
jgi:amino acid transporter